MKKTYRTKQREPNNEGKKYLDPNGNGLGENFLKK